MCESEVSQQWGPLRGKSSLRQGQHSRAGQRRSSRRWPSRSWRPLKCHLFVAWTLMAGRSHVTLGRVFLAVGVGPHGERHHAALGQAARTPGAAALAGCGVPGTTPAAPHSPPKGPQRWTAPAGIRPWAGEEVKLRESGSHGALGPRHPHLRTGLAGADGHPHHRSWRVRGSPARAAWGR